MTDRAQLVERLRRNLEGYGWPRVQLFLIVSLAGFAGFIVSYALLSAGLASMAARYAVAGTSAYVAFLALLGAWLWWKRSDLDLNPLDYVEVPLPRSRGGSAVHGFTGGRSGGGGSSASFGEGRTSGGSGASWLDGDADLGWVVLAVGAALVALFAVFYVVWIAPALLAEVLVDAVIVSAVSHRLARAERRDWTATVVRRTWLPAALTIAMLTVAGYALQRAVPEARSIGPAVETILNR